MSNQKTSEVILFDRYDVTVQNKTQYFTVYAIGGKTYNINVKYESACQVIKQAVKNDPIWLIFDSFTPQGENREVKYISDAQLVTFEAIHKAGLQTTLNKLLVASEDERNRSQAISYSKDLIVAERMELKDLFDKATDIFAFIKGVEL